MHIIDYRINAVFGAGCNSPPAVMEQKLLAREPMVWKYQADSGAIPEPTVKVRMKEAAQPILASERPVSVDTGRFFVDSGKGSVL